MVCHDVLVSDDTRNNFEADTLFSVAQIGASHQHGKALPSWRRKIIALATHIACRTQLCILGITFDVTKMTHDDVNYKYYLGDDYKNELKELPISTYIAPHTAGLDIQLMASALGGKLSFVAGDFTLGIPAVAAICKALGCIFVPRGGSKEALEKTLHLIEERQQHIEDGEGFSPFIIFPEGTCSNNTCLRKFKRGAFSALRPVCPVAIRYHWTAMSPALDVLDEYINLPLLCMNTAPIRAEVKIMPSFQPNQYLFTKHADKAQEQWQIYAWATRDLIAKVGGFGKHDISYKHSITLYKYLNKQRDDYINEPEAYPLDMLVSTDQQAQPDSKKDQ